MQKFQSTLPTRGSDYDVLRFRVARQISIHAPHEGERRRAPFCPWRSCTYFNPRSPRGGATFNSLIVFVQLEISIHAPHEGERRRAPFDINDLAANFNPRSPRGGATWARLQGTIHRRYFNPRSPRGGATHCCYSIAQFCRRFQSTLPTRGSDGMNLYLCTDYLHISIHAPHEGERP